MKLWKDYFALLLEFEGTAYECDPADPGGPTKFGIDQRSHPTVRIRQLTRDGAERIYLAEFAASAASKLPEPFSEMYFDFAVNAGESRAAKALQGSVGVREDGAVGPATLAGVKTLIESDGGRKLIWRFTARRDNFYLNLAHTRPTMNRFLKGWLVRSEAMLRWAVVRLDEGGQEV